MAGSGAIRAGAALLAAGLVSACAWRGEPIAVTPAPAPPPAAESVAPPEPRASALDPLAAFYAAQQEELILSGLMRRDTSPADAPFTPEDLVRNFERIAFYDEYVEVQGRFVQSETPVLLRRWDRPVRVGVVIGPSVPEKKASTDRRNVAEFTARLAQLTGLDMEMSEGEDVNFLVMILTRDEQEAFADDVALRHDRFDAGGIEAFRALPVEIFCASFTFVEPANPFVYSAVMVVIKAEHPELTRLACVHEEMAQSMGLPNDSREARPSLFTDTLEFALLTDHDAILLRMLYDPRLSPGMSAADARPLLPDIARDAMRAQGIEPPPLIN